MVVEAGAKTAEEPAELPLSGLSHVVFWGRARATLPVLRSLEREGVASYFCRADGELESVFVPHEPDWRLWLGRPSPPISWRKCGTGWNPWCGP